MVHCELGRKFKAKLFYKVHELYFVICGFYMAFMGLLRLVARLS